MSPPSVNITFSESDLNYIYLIYWCTNNCILTDQWKKEDIEHVQQVVFSNEYYRRLIQKLEDTFQLSSSDSPTFRSMMFHFYKKCLMNLQCIIPDKQFYIDSKKDPLTLSVSKKLSEVLTSWRLSNQLPYPIDRGHIYYLSSQIVFLMQSFMPRVDVFVLSDLISELNVWKLFLKRNFSPERVHIHAVLLNATSLDFLSSLENSVIIAKKMFIPFLTSLDFSESNALLSFSSEINSNERKQLDKAINRCEKEHFAALLSQTNI